MASDPNFCLTKSPWISESAWSDLVIGVTSECWASLGSGNDDTEGSVTMLLNSALIGIVLVVSLALMSGRVGSSASGSSVGSVGGRVVCCSLNRPDVWRRLALWNWGRGLCCPLACWILYVVRAEGGGLGGRLDLFLIGRLCVAADW